MPSTSARGSTRYYETTTMCPHCGKLVPGEVYGRDGAVFLGRSCPEHGPVEALVCSDVGWFESLPRFDVTPVKPSWSQTETSKGCPDDCGLCPAHRQIAGTAAIEISNRCNSSCPVCLADNQGTFDLSVEEISRLVDDAVREQGTLGVLTLSGGEPTIHPRFFDILRALDRPEIGRINLNSNGRRIAEDDRFLDELARHPKVYVSLHFDGQNAMRIRGVDPELQERALERLCRWNIAAVPLVLAVRGQNEGELGTLVPALLQRSKGIKTLILSLMAYTGRGGGAFPADPLGRLTIPSALDCIERGSGGAIRKLDFIPVPMPNPICAAIGYFLVDEEGIAPLVQAAGVERTVACIQNEHFARPDEKFEALFREMIDNVYARSDQFPHAERMLQRFRAFLGRLFPDGRPIAEAQRKALAEESIKTVFVMQFMDSWTFDSVRLAKCSCQHLMPGDRRIPSCGYYAYHRRFDPRFPAGSSVR